MDGLAVGGFEGLQVSPKDVVGLAGREALFELTVVIGIDFPSRLIGLVLATPDLYGDAIDWSVIGSPHSPNDQGVGLPAGFLSGEEAIVGTEGGK
jgi:hypothetical protein